ncbi:M23 family metallopeptidase [Streptomyces sp. GS7]|uniref:M23 family metallopeptidase n=1 Tax=Streptomyces sp. GS7 TaxID=2692234 RepID=UPI001317F7D3|nr:M23 family metallopeptidase [Streptomyces sp. GS7]QHC25876.1 peptidoglycan DD-metalloendopeptidase family protein [Streptomyces sp. GS7]
MDDRHPSGAQLHTAPASDASYAQPPAYGDGDALFGSLPGSYDQGGYGTGGYPPDGRATAAYGTGSYATATYDTGGYGTAGYDPYAHTAYDTGAYATTAYEHTGGYDSYESAAYAGGYPGGATYDTGSYPTGTYDNDTYDNGSYASTGYDTGAYATTGYDTATALQDPGGHEATAVWSTADYAPGIPAQAGPPAADTVQWDAASWRDTGAYGTAESHQQGAERYEYETPEEAAPPQAAPDTEPAAEPGTPGDPASIADAMTQAMPVAAPAPAAGSRRVSGPEPGKAVRGGGRGRRRPAKRSALLTVAVPSVAAMGVCAAAAASVGQFGGDGKDNSTTQAAADTASVKASPANKKLDSQLAGLNAGAQDFRERASRTQERLDLKERQAQERKRKAEEAAAKEAARPKFVLPVTQHGLSALFGQAGVNWMSVHTGIDFPVSYGTPVMSATDGTVRTQWNSAYGNMAIVTAPDGTETWYCHLSSTKVRSGSVKAGDQIAYSGNSGNSTGPHLHFEVRPDGGAAVDPIPWLRSHDLNPY